MKKRQFETSPERESSNSTVDLTRQQHKRQKKESASESKDTLDPEEKPTQQESEGYAPRHRLTQRYMELANQLQNEIQSIKKDKVEG